MLDRYYSCDEANRYHHKLLGLKVVTRKENSFMSPRFAKIVFGVSFSITITAIYDLHKCDREI